jgi:23S rRNA (cytosine1962-C5)-methyltransferase
MAGAYQGGGKGPKKRRGQPLGGGSPKPRVKRGVLPFQTDAGDAVMVNSYSERWLQRGFQWVYKDEVIGRTGPLQPGQVVSIVSRDGQDLGTGIWDEGKVEVRRLREQRGPIDGAFVVELVARALARRRLGPDTTAWRWIHGENDDFPGVRVDVWGSHLSLLLDSRSYEGLIDPLVDALTSQRDVESIHLGWRPRQDEAAISAFGCIWGTPPTEHVLVSELGLQYAVHPGRGLDAGLYPDMRGVRKWLQGHWSGRSVLNTFSYTAAFSVAAAAHGAREVVTVDLAASAIERARANFEINGLDTSAHRFLVEDTFKALDRMRRKGERFDLVIADPPSFSHGPDGTWKMSRDMPRLVAACLRVLEPHGWILVATNQGSVSPKEFQKMIQSGADRAGRRVRLVHQGTPPHDFPAALHFPESRYLKAWVLEA